MRALDLACDSDHDARAEAAGLLKTQSLELWDRARLIARFDPETESDAT